MALSKRSTTASRISSGCKFNGGNVKRRYLRYRRFAHKSCKRRTDRSSSARTIGSAGWSPARASKVTLDRGGGVLFAHGSHSPNIGASASSLAGPLSPLPAQEGQGRIGGPDLGASHVGDSASVIARWNCPGSARARPVRVGGASAASPGDATKRGRNVQTAK